MKKSLTLITLLLLLAFSGCDQADRGDQSASLTSEPGFQISANMTAEAQNYYYGTEDQGDRVLLWFTPKSGSTWVDVHYRKNSEGQLNHRMTNTGSRFEQQTIEFTLSAGDTVTFSFTYDVGGLAYDSPVYTYTFGGSSDSGVAIPATGTVQIEAESFTGMYGIQTENCSEGTLNVGWIDNGDWLDYKINVASAGTYTIVYRIANLYSTGIISFRLDGNALASTAVTNTGGWQIWNTVSAEVSLPAGIHTVRLYAAGSPWNLNWFSITKKTGTEGGWAVVWEDNFDGSGSLDRNNWNFHIGNGFNPGISAFAGWGNGEWEWYRSQNAYRENGNLVIKAEYYDSPLTIAGRQWYQTSARVTTQGLRAFKYGRIEARIAMPNSSGMWPAFWMMGESCDATYNAPNGTYDVMASNWSSCGEIDIMEHRNTETVVCHNLFWDSRTGLFPWADGMNNNAPTENAPVGNVAQYHLYSIEWDATQIRWYVDRDVNPTPTKVIDITPSNMEEFHQKFFIILNLAIGGQFTYWSEPDKPSFPLYMYVDYVKVWQKQ